METLMPDDNAQPMPTPEQGLTRRQAFRKTKRVAVTKPLPHWARYALLGAFILQSFYYSRSSPQSTCSFVHLLWDRFLGL